MDPANTEKFPFLAARKNDMTVKAPVQASLSVSLARNGTLATHMLSADEELEVSRVTNSGITVSVKGDTTDSSLDLPIAPLDTSERVEISRTEDNLLILTSATPTSVRSRVARVANFIPATRTSKRSTTSTTVASIEISEPD